VQGETLKVGKSENGLISIRNLWKIYQMGEVNVEALRDVSMEIGAGEFVAIMGASGSGKSTLLNILGCLDRPTRGMYWLDGADVSTFSAAQRADIRNQKIGFMFQNFNLLARTSVWENVETPMLYSGLPRGERSTRVEKVLSVWENVETPMLYSGVPRGERSTRVEKVLSIVGIPEKAKALPNQLSGGQQQRVAVARALVNRPALVLADEPTGNLDSTTSEELLQFLQRLNREERITLLMVTHDRDIARYASRTIQMKDGQIVDPGDGALA
jgi:ABC-type lipoprotein export system ATPase subunit